MEAWIPTENFDLLIIEEALYYLPPTVQISLLEKAFDHMGDTGVAIIALHSRSKYSALIERLRNRWEIRTELNEGDRSYLILTPSGNPPRN